MRIIRTLAFAVALAACTPPAQQPPQQPPQQADASNKPGDAPPPPASTPQSAGKPGSAPEAAATQITPQFLVGRWGDNGDCSKDVVFNGDGSFRSYSGGTGSWQINGDTIIMSGAEGRFSLQAQMIDQNRLMLRNPDGSIATSQRC